MALTRVRFRFAKRGDLRLVSHHDLMRCLERALRRARLPVATTQGFTPRPRAVFPLALALGIEGRAEVLELDFADYVEPLEVMARLSAVLPDGFDLLDARLVPPGRSVQPAAARYHLAIPEDRRAEAGRHIADFLSFAQFPVSRMRGEKRVEYDLRPRVLSMALDVDGQIVFVLKVEPTGSARPEELLEALALYDLLEKGAVLVRDAIDLADAESAREPQELVKAPASGQLNPQIDAFGAVGSPP